MARFPMMNAQRSGKAMPVGLMGLALPEGQ